MRFFIHPSSRIVPPFEVRYKTDGLWHLENFFDDLPSALNFARSHKESCIAVKHSVIIYYRSKNKTDWFPLIGGEIK
jgi:hypothetical protein